MSDHIGKHDTAPEAPEELDRKIIMGVAKAGLRSSIQITTEQNLTVAGFMLAAVSTARANRQDLDAVLILCHHFVDATWDMVDDIQVQKAMAEAAEERRKQEGKK